MKWSGTRLVSALAVLIAAALLVPRIASAQVHERQFGSYVVRSNVIPSTFLTGDIAQRHGIARAKDRAVLNVVILSDSGDPRSSVPARVTARVSASTLATPVAVPMREVHANGGTSYVGTFEVVSGEVAQVDIAVQPWDSSHTLEMQFRNTMP